MERDYIYKLTTEISVTFKKYWKLEIRDKVNKCIISSHLYETLAKAKKKIQEVENGEN